MNRERVENVLLAMGISEKLKGFRYISDALEIIDKEGRDISITKELYPAIAKRNDTKASRVERAIRYAFSVARNHESCKELVSHYIGFVSRKNSNSIMMLHAVLEGESV